MQRVQRAAAWAAVLLLCSAGLALAQEPVNAPGYNCPRSCYKDPNCHCASHEIPGGLGAWEIPQFVVLTNDDAITVTTMPVILDITKNIYNPQGCEVPATWFVSMNYTDYHLVQEVYMKNHEIATHTLHHVADPDLFQIVGMKLWLNQTAHVPLEKIRGFRAPFLMHSPAQREILAQNGFLYDSSIPEPFPTATSPSENVRLWPYTMDYGLPQRCDLGTGPCAVNETHKGLWEFPMWDVQDANGMVLTNMDPQGDLYEAYKREFDRSYSGNRSPVGVYIHAAWLMDPTRAQQMASFMNYALGNPDVWFVTISEVLDWMKNPVNATEYAEQRQKKGCAPPTDMWFPSGEFCQGISCVNGNFSDDACSCTCIAEFITNQPGWCVDPETKACTVAKVWSNTDKAFACPDHARRDWSNSPSPSYSPPADPSTANCGHELQDFVGLGISGTEDNSALYTQALRAVDGLCDTCASATDPEGNYFTVVLPASTTVTSVQLQTGETVEGAFIFLGESGSNNGMDNPVCAMNVDLPANTASSVSCEGVGKYLTIATPKNLSLCDIYVNGWSSSPEPSPEPLPVAAEEAPAAGLPTAEDSADAEASALSSALIDSLLTDPGTFATTSAEEEKAQPDMSRVGMEGVIVTGNTAAETNAKLTQQLVDTYEAEIAVINANAKP